MNWILSPLYYLVIISMAVSVISLTVTKTKIFKSLRLWIDPSLAKTGAKKTFWGDLFTCPYCFSFYPSLMFVIGFYDKLRLTFGPSFYVHGTEISPFDFVIAWFVIICMASFFTGFIYRSISQIE
jgi:hypothetical protein